MTNAARPTGRRLRRNRTSIVGSCLALAVLCAVAVGAFGPTSADATQRNHERETKTRCTESTTTTTEVPTTTTIAATTTLSIEDTTTVAPTTVALVATTVTSEASTSTTIAASTTVAETTVPESTTTADTFERGTSPSTPVPSFAVAGSTEALPTTSRPPSALVEGSAAPVAPVAPVSASLPRTGADSALPVIVGITCLAAGILLLLRRGSARAL